MTTPCVSVVMAVRDGERYLEEAVASVQAQTFDDLELIVVDDGSDDGTPALLRSLRGSLRSVRQPPTGLAVALNNGVSAATGAMLAFLDADDLWVPDKLALQVPALVRDPALDVVLGHVREFASPELSGAERAAIATPRDNLPGLSKGTMLIRRESFARVGPFDPAWRVGDFVDWYARAIERGLRSLVMPEVVMLRRLHAGNTTRNTPDAQVDYARIARAALTRRRRDAREQR